jgi:hypothetical protein
MADIIIFGAIFIAVIAYTLWDSRNSYHTLEAKASKKENKVTNVIKPITEVLNPEPMHIINPMIADMHIEVMENTTPTINPMITALYEEIMDGNMPKAMTGGYDLDDASNIDEYYNNFWNAALQAEIDAQYQAEWNKYYRSQGYDI